MLTRQDCVDAVRCTFTVWRGPPRDVYQRKKFDIELFRLVRFGVFLAKKHVCVEGKLLELLNGTLLKAADEPKPTRFYF